MIYLDTYMSYFLNITHIYIDIRLIFNKAYLKYTDRTFNNYILESVNHYKQNRHLTNFNKIGTTS